MFPLAFVGGWLQGHWWGFISRNYVVCSTFLLMNVFIALKGSHFWFLFKKAFDRVWHEALWATMRKQNINASIIRTIENLYDKAQCEVLFNGSTGEWFRPTTGVRQWYLLSPTLFNIFLERIMCEALYDHEGTVSIGGRLINNFHFANDTVAHAEEEEEAGVLVDRLDTTTTRYKMETRQKWWQTTQMAYKERSR